MPHAIVEETGLEGADRTVPPPAGFVGVDGGLGPDALGPGERVPPPPPPPPPPPQLPVRLHAGMETPKKVTNIAPVYPAVARVARVQGVVILDAIIDAQGAVTSVRVLRSIALLDQAAVEAVRQWRFTPARLNGVAVPVIMTVTIRFTLDR
jgi:protein TonB